MTLEEFNKQLQMQPHPEKIEVKVENEGWDDPTLLLEKKKGKYYLIIF